MSRRRFAIVCCAGLVVALMGPAFGQDGATGTPPERIDLTVAAPTMRTTDEACQRRQDAAVVSGEIVVCGSRPGELDPRYSSREDAANRYAARTAFRNDPATPDVAGAGIFRGPATLSGVCIKGILNCPKPPALIVDVTKLPQAPPGSDADRIARGLEPLGQSGNETQRRISAQERAELGLPPPSPAAAASPAAPQ